jgi:hypothetical protein
VQGARVIHLWMRYVVARAAPAHAAARDELTPRVGADAEGPEIYDYGGMPGWANVAKPASQPRS